MLHKLAHLFGWNTGHAYSWWDGNKLMMGFKCHGCGSIEGIHECKRHAGGGVMCIRTPIKSTHNDDMSIS